MKLAALFYEDIHPDLAPAIQKMNDAIVAKIRAAGVEIMPAHTDLGMPRYTKKGPYNYDFNQGYRWVQKRWSQRWLVGYIKMGAPYLAVFAGLDGDILTELQHKSGPPDSQNVNENYYRHYHNVDEFITFLEKKLKPFASSEPIKRFEKFVFESQPIVHYPPPAKINTGNELDDEDEFYNQHGGLDKHMGIVAASKALGDMVRQGQSIDHNNITTMFSGMTMKTWMDQSGIEPGGELEWDNWVAANPKEVYIADSDGKFLRNADWPREVNGLLLTYARAVARKVISRAKNIAAKPKKPPPPPPEERLLRAIFGDNPPANPPPQEGQ